MEFTKAQNDAIFTRGTNILVSAGAGSGKTAVLSQRVIERLKEGLNIDEFVILTFTKAAAEEMKTRIKKKIKLEPTLLTQLVRLDNAMISTFDSFCLRIVKTYGYYNGIPSDIHLTDALIVQTLKEQVFNQVLEEAYHESNPKFISTLSLLFDKGDQTLVSGLKKFINLLERIPLPINYLRNYQNQFFTDDFEQKIIGDFFSLLQEEITDIYHSYLPFKEEFYMIEDKIKQFFETYDIIISNLKSREADDLLSYIQTISFPRKPTLKEDPDWNQSFTEAHDVFKVGIQNLKKKLKTLFIEKTEDIQSSYHLSTEHVTLFVELAHRYFELLESTYFSESIYDYNRIMNLAISLFEENELLRDQFKNSIKEIMIDEYQDTNDFQEYLMNLISNHNLFMVGDMKQSIYGFRNANPANFLRKYLSYDKDQLGKVIVLDQNYRSRNEVLQDINMIFSELMDERIGGINYHDRQALTFGREAFLSHQVENYQSEVVVYDSVLEKEKNRDFNSSEYEAKIVCADIIHKIKNGYQVFDTDENKLRLASPKDFAILIDRKSSFDIYERIFQENGLPILKVSDSSFSSEVEILTIHQLLRFMLATNETTYYKQYFKTSLYGVLRSFVFQVEDSKALDLIVSLKGNMQEDLAIISNAIGKDFIESFKVLYAASKIEPLAMFFETFINKFDLFNKMLQLENPLDSQRRVHHLYHLASELEGYTLESFVLYLDKIYNDSEFDIEYTQMIDFSEDKVKLLSIHKSKGLEFPVCYFSGLTKKFNFQPDKSAILFDQAYGLYIPPYMNGFYDSAVKLLMDRRSKESFLSEQIRLFYVALTRAKEKIIFIVDESKMKPMTLYKDSFGVILPSTREKISSFSTLLAMVEGLKSRYQTALIHSDVYVPDKPSQERLTYPKERKTISFVSKNVEMTHFSKEQLSIPSKSQIEAMNFGSEVHLQMEAFPWKNYHQAISLVDPSFKRYIEKFYERFEEDIKESISILQEYAFTENKEDKTYHGVIDFIIIKKTEVIVIDYKLKNIEDEAYIMQVTGYMDYLKGYFPNHQMKGFLYSLISTEMKEVRS
ncbi:MAG: UvrD-helicase domain-containing protein [Candidatus Izemoplasmatales bacterium]